MGRRKRVHAHLPRRMRFSHNAWYHVDGRGGKTKWTRLGDTYGAALIRYAELESQDRRDVSALLTAFIAYPGRAAATQKNYKAFAKRLRGVFGKLPPSVIEVQHARRYLDEHPLTSMARHEIALLSSALSWGAERGWLRSNPLLGFRKGKVGRRHRLITDAEFAALLAHARPDAARAVQFLYQTGLRVRDALALRWSDAKADGLHVKIHKTKTAIVMEGVDLKPHRTGSVVSMHILTGTNGRPLTYTILRRQFKAAAVLAGCPDVTIHDIRRKRLTDLTNSEGVAAAQALAAHMDPKTTRGYYSDVARVKV
jgi:integrase